MNIADSIKQVRQRIERDEKIIEALNLIAERLPSLECSHSVQIAGIDFDRPTREQTLEIIRGLAAGKWVKSVNYDGDKLNYVNDTMFAGLSLRIWASPPPPSCRIIEIEEDVPEQIVAAHKKKVRKLVCSEVGHEPPKLVEEMVEAAP